MNLNIIEKPTEAIKMNNLNNHKVSESDLIKRIILGEKELYEVLVRRNNQKLFRVIRGYIREAAEIEDIMQNTYLKAYEKLYQFKHTSTYSTWLIRIGINETLARLREKSKVYNLNENRQSFESNTVLEMPDSNQLDPEKKIIRNEAKQLLEDAIDNLDVKYRSVYILKEIEEMSMKEISTCLNISTSNVKVRFHRAKKILKENLYELSYDKNVFEFGFSKCDRITQNVMNSIV